MKKQISLLIGILTLIIVTPVVMASFTQVAYEGLFSDSSGNLLNESLEVQLRYRESTCTGTILVTNNVTTNFTNGIPNTVLNLSTPSASFASPIYFTVAINGSAELCYESFATLSSAHSNKTTYFGDQLSTYYINTSMTSSNTTILGSFPNIRINETWADAKYTNTNAGTLCSDGEYLDGDTSCNVFNDSVTALLTTTYYNATQSLAVVGTVDGGTLADTQHQDGDYDGLTFNFSEVAASPGLDMRMNFTSISEFNRGIMRYKTSTLKGDYPLIQVWSYTDADWENYGTLGEATSFYTIEQSVFDDSDHINNSVVQMRLYKAATGNTNNNYFVDWISISKGVGTPAGQEVDPFSVHRDGTVELTSAWDVGSYDLIAKSFNGSWNNSGLYYTASEVDSIVPYSFPSANITAGTLGAGNYVLPGNLSMTSAGTDHKITMTIGFLENKYVTDHHYLYLGMNTDKLIGLAEPTINPASRNLVHFNPSSIDMDVKFSTDATDSALFVNGDGNTVDLGVALTSTSGASFTTGTFTGDVTAKSFNGSWNNSGLYYAKTEIDTQGEVEAIWSVNLATDTELAAQDECSEITNCVPNAWDAQADIASDGLSEAKIDFDTVCGSGSRLYVSGNDLACEAGGVTTYSLPAANITTGTFGAGDYVMPGNLTVNDNVYLQPNEKIYLNGTGSTDMYVYSDGTNVYLAATNLSIVMYSNKNITMNGLTSTLTIE